LSARRSSFFVIPERPSLSLARSLEQLFLGLALLRLHRLGELLLGHRGATVDIYPAGLLEQLLLGHVLKVVPFASLRC
jgi:hypothetical protein